MQSQQIIQNNNPRTYQRRDQFADLFLSEAVQNDKITIHGWDWIQGCLNKLSKELHGMTFDIYAKESKNSKTEKVIDQFTVEENKLTPNQLEMIARNEEVNIDGNIKFDLYGSLANKKRSTILACKDLVKFLMMMGQDKLLSYGGYKSKVTPLTEEHFVILADLMALQFQASYNTGLRLFITTKEPQEVGLLDNEIYQALLKENRPTYEDCLKNPKRFIKLSFKDKKLKTGYFDSAAYRAVVVQDFLSFALRTQDYVQENKIESGICLRPNKYGTGFFSDALRPKNFLTPYLLDGVFEALTVLFKNPENYSQIKHIDLAWYKNEKDLNEFKKHPELYDALMAKYDAIEKLCLAHGFPAPFSMNDVVQPLYDSNKKPLLTSASVPTDPHAKPGNEWVQETKEMWDAPSVDPAAFASTQGKGHSFNPCLNKKMKSKLHPWIGYQIVAQEKLESMQQHAREYKKEHQPKAESKAQPDLVPQIEKKPEKIADIESNAKQNLCHEAQTLFLKEYKAEFKLCVKETKRICFKTEEQALAFAEYLYKNGIGRISKNAHSHSLSPKKPSRDPAALMQSVIYITAEDEKKIEKISNEAGYESLQTLKEKFKAQEIRPVMSCMVTFPNNKIGYQFLKNHDLVSSLTTPSLNKTEYIEKNGTCSYYLDFIEVEKVIRIQTEKNEKSHQLNASIPLKGPSPSPTKEGVFSP